MTFPAEHQDHRTSEQIAEQARIDLMPLGNILVETIDLADGTTAFVARRWPEVTAFTLDAVRELDGLAIAGAITVATANATAIYQIEGINSEGELVCRRMQVVPRRAPTEGVR